MPTKSPITLNPTDTLSVRTAGLQLLTPLKATVSALSITSASDYLDADEALGKIRNSRAKWQQLMEPISGPLERAMKELKESQKGVKSLNAAIDGPMEGLELKVKGLMRQFKIEEQRQLQEAETERQAQLARLAREVAQKAAQEAAAKTAPMRAKLAQKRAELEAEAESVRADPEVNLNPVKGGSSTARHTLKPQITNLEAFVAAIRNYEPKADLYEFSHPPLSIIKVEMLQTALMAIYRQTPGIVKSWPGVTIVDDVIIAGR